MRGFEPWEYETDRLITLCQSCHNNEYQIRPDNEQKLLSALRLKAFTSDEILIIANAFEALEVKYGTDVTATFIEFIFSNRDAINCEWDLYWFHMDHKANATKKKDG